MITIGNFEAYKKYKPFLSKINNEFKIEESYRKRIIGLEKFVMLQFDKDRIIAPIITAHFGYYKNGQYDLF
jgi:hypothetical protein